MDRSDIRRFAGLARESAGSGPTGMEEEFSMDQRNNSEAVPDVDAPGPGEQILLGAVRLASLPFFLLAIVLMFSIYGVAFLARCIGILVGAGHRRRERSIRPLGRSTRPQDA
jgi:hypothetical protein